MRARTKGIVLVSVLAGAAVAAGAVYPPVRLFAIKAVGRSPVCPMRNALLADHNLQQQVRHKDEILKGSRLVEKDAQGYQLFETPRGRWWIPAGNEFVLPWNLAEQARELYGSGEFGVRAGDIALDCGGNVGTWTRAALDSGAKLVVAFEPAPENIESFRRNFREEIAAGRVILVPKGVWDKEDVLTLRRDPLNSAANSFVMLHENGNSVQAPLTTIDRVMEELKIERVDYIKMDIEGAETRALEGARNTIVRYHPRLSIAAEHLPTDEVRIPEVVKSLWSGYRMTCGPCLETPDGHIRPDALYFQ
jgi:FkbM family methyltransferase